METEESTLLAAVIRDLESALRDSDDESAGTAAVILLARLIRGGNTKEAIEALNGLT
jgi:hypothetical protein